MRKTAVALLLSLGIPLLGQELMPLSSELFIPVSLKKTLRAEKVRAGEQVHFRTEEAVLVGRGIVMPKGTELEGTVLVSSKKSPGAPSVLSFVVTSARWKNVHLELHAFVAGVGISRVSATRPANCDSFLNSLNGSGSTFGPSARRSGLRGSRTGTTFSNNTSQDCASDDRTFEDQMAKAAQADMKDVKLFRSRLDDAILLVSMKRNIRLHSWVLLMLRNSSPQTTKELSQK